MEIKIGKRTIASRSIFKMMFIMVLMATIAQMIINVLSGSDMVTGMVIFSACITGVCYYFGRKNSN